MGSTLELTEFNVLHFVLYRAVCRVGVNGRPPRLAALDVRKNEVPLGDLLAKTKLGQAMYIYIYIRCF